MTSQARTPAGKSRRLSLSVTDILFLILVILLVFGHLQDLSTGKVVSVLFVLQQVTVIIFTLSHRSPQSVPAPWRDILLAWGGTLLPLAIQPNGPPPM